MNEPENFFTRWARRKAEAIDPKPAAIETATATPPPQEQVQPEEPTSASEQQSATASAPVARDAAPPAAIDPKTLPPIESIGAGTDIRAFLRAGVPAELTRAALRRAWGSDPAIRDFVGLSENSWDFTAPGGVPGFGPLSTEDANRLMAQFSSTTKEIANKAKQVVQQIDQFEPTEAIPQPEESRLPPAGGQATRDENQAQESAKPNTSSGELSSLQRNENHIATQKEDAESSEDTRPIRRSHGTALPK